MTALARAAALATALCLTALPAGCGPGHGRAASPLDPRLGPANDCAAFADPRLQANLDARTGSRVRDGNSAELLVNGKASFARRIANATGADLILVKTFIFADDEVGRRLAALLSERARAGALVIVQYDVKGSAGGAPLRELASNGDLQRPLGERDIMRGLRDAGVIVVPTNPPTRALQLQEWRDNIVRLFRDPHAALERAAGSLAILNHSDHEKYWLTGRVGPDGQVSLRAIVGGMNVASEYAYGGTRLIDKLSRRRGWRDTDVELSGPVLPDLVNRFFDVMAHHTGHPVDPAWRARWTAPQPAVGSARVRFVWNQPALSLRRAIEKLYATLIDATPRGAVVRLEHAYFAPSRLVRRALYRAMHRGTRLAVLTNSPETSDIGVLVDASRFAYSALLREDAVVALFERRPRPDLGETTLHSKVASFGTCGPVIIGSANLDAQSAEHNSEDVVVIDDPALRHAFDAMYDTDIAADRAQRITLARFRELSVLDWIKATWAFVLGDYWL